jgi:ABC-type multidrug transport system permease subunit
MGAGVAVGGVARRAVATTGAMRFALAVALSGAVLFLAGMVEVAGSWSVSVGALVITIASIAGVIAMEGQEELVPSSPPPVLDRPLSRST